MINIGKIKCIL